MGASCPVCKTISIFEYRHPEVDLYRCPDCDHCFSEPTSIIKQEEYSQEYYEADHKNWFNNPNLALFNTAYGFIREAGSNLSVLDIGCGKGDFLKCIKRKDMSLHLFGIDLSENQPIDGITIIQGDALAADFDRKFDVITSFAVIEHIADVQGFVKRLGELCNPGGLVIIMTLDDRSVLYSAARMLNRLGFGVPFERLYSKHHVNHFNTSSLRRLVISNGFSVTKVLHHNAPLNAIDFAASSQITNIVFKIGVLGTFILGQALGRTYLQTIICRKDK
ncbi:MAG TPA: class I SAM-dependent methyltransferase [Candidatus Aquicultor sp.]